MYVCVCVEGERLLIGGMIAYMYSTATNQRCCSFDRVYVCMSQSSKVSEAHTVYTRSRKTDTDVCPRTGGSVRRGEPASLDLTLSPRWAGQVSIILPGSAPPQEFTH